MSGNILRRKLLTCDWKSALRRFNSNADSPKKENVDSFVPNNKTPKFKDRLYVWGYAGIGALGSRLFTYTHFSLLVC